MITLRFAVSGGIMLALLAAVHAAQIDDPDKPLEVVFRYIAAGCQKHVPCYLAVEGKSPSQALVKRLRDLPNTRPVTEYEHTGRRRDDRALLMNLGRAELLPDGSARVVELTTMGDRTVSSCSYVLSHDQDGWQIVKQKSMCDLT